MAFLEIVTAAAGHSALGLATLLTPGSCVRCNAAALFRWLGAWLGANRLWCCGRHYAPRFRWFGWFGCVRIVVVLTDIFFPCLRHLSEVLRFANGQAGQGTLAGVLQLLAFALTRCGISGCVGCALWAHGLQYPGVLQLRPLSNIRGSWGSCQGGISRTPWGRLTRWLLCCANLWTHTRGRGGGAGGGLYTSVKGHLRACKRAPADPE